VPVLYERKGEVIRLRGHFARPNPHARLSGPATLILQGPDHYLSPSWYPDKEAAARVPTWNYVVAHFEGELSVFEDETRLAELVDDLSQRFEATVGGDWRFHVDDPRMQRQLNGITGFELAVERFSLKAKLSQNHPSANREATIAALRDLDRSPASAVADWMQSALDRDTSHRNPEENA